MARLGQRPPKKRYKEVRKMNAKWWKQRARELAGQAYALYLAVRHPRTPWYAKVFAALVVGYVFSPIDPIPDFIPGVGLLDEVVVVPMGVLIATKMIPREVLEECRERPARWKKARSLSVAWWASSPCGYCASRWPSSWRCASSEADFREDPF